MSETPVLILREGTSRSRGRDAQRSNIMAAKIVAEIVRSTIGPRGMDKMLVAGMGDIVITNDGATIMKEMDVQNPAAKMIVEIAKTQDSEVGDGTTTAVVLAGELLAGAETLLDKDVHPNAIIDGEISHSQMPKSVTGAKIALLNAKLEIEKTETDAKININKPEEMYQFIQEEEKLLRDMADQVTKTGANVLFTEKSVDDEVLSILAKKGILTIKNISSSDMEKLAKATGGSVVGTTRDLSKEALGYAKLVEEVKIGDDKLVYVREAKNPKAVTIMIRGGSEHVVDEAERSLHDALSVVRNAVEDGKIVAGGGAPEIELSKRLREYAIKVGGREQLAVTAFAEALESIPVAIAQNAGINPIDILVDLKSKHNTLQNIWFGVNTKTGKAADMLKMDVVEPLRVKSQVMNTAVEAVTMILRVDDDFASKGGRSPGPGAGGPGGMPPGMGGGMPPGMMGEM